jgi:hypothetical protein
MPKLLSRKTKDIRGGIKLHGDQDGQSSHRQKEQSSTQPGVHDAHPIGFNRILAVSAVTSSQA